jgi:hypothetical protein
MVEIEFPIAEFDQQELIPALWWSEVDKLIPLDYFLPV